MAETIQYEGSSIIGKFISDADKIYPHAFFTINVASESQGGELCVVSKSCELANRTHVSTKEIETMIQALQSGL